LVTAGQEERVPRAGIEPGDLLDFLAGEGVLKPADVNRLTRAAAETREPLCRLIPKLGLLEEKSLAQALGRWLNLPVLTKEAVPSEPVLKDRLNPGFLRAQGLLPLAVRDGTLFVATADPLSAYNAQALALASGLAVTFVVASASDVEAALRQLYDDGESAAELLEPGSGAAPSDDEDLQRLKDMAAEAPVIRYVNHLLQEAVERRASDIHLEPFLSELRVRLRIDGHLTEIGSPPPQLGPAILSRVKLLAKLNIAERRLPQDGRIRTVIRGKPMDVRISTAPTLYGESVVLRLLDKTQVSFNFLDLGFEETDLKRFLEMVAKPNGIVLVTGPTGSGKTTTLYTCLLHLNTIESKILTVEDPVEYELPGINQIQVKPQIGLTFSTALRSLVRQDPDIILIGEIRDLETAEIASQSALTGHRVLSTLHTNDAASAITRLVDMGLPEFLIAATLRGILAQRLVRRLCPACKVERPVPREFAHGTLATSGSLFEPQGCEACGGTGYRGRLGIYEVLPVSAPIRDMIGARAPANEIETVALEGGMTSLFEDGLRKVARGVTSLAEVLRATKEA
jgi:general secretion pathway protein E